MRSTSKFCSADETLGIIGALFNVDLNGKTYQPCEPVGSTTSTSSSTTSTSTSTSSTTTSLYFDHSSTTTAPAPTKPVNTNPPTLSGTTRQGEQLETTNGTWAGTPTRYTYAWEKCKSSCAVVSGATKQTYNLGSGAVGYRLESVVTATNTAGSASATSAESAVVTKKRRG